MNIKDLNFLEYGTVSNGKWLPTSQKSIFYPSVVLKSAEMAAEVLRAETAVHDPNYHYSLPS